MATVLENLQARYAAVAAELAAMSPTAAGGKPDAGKSGIQHVAYRRSLLDEMKFLNDAINQEQINQNMAMDGFDMVTIGTT